MANLTKEQRKLKEQGAHTAKKADPDQEIIDANPDKDPYELLQLGISQGKYQQLMAALTAPKEKAKQNVTPAPAPQAPAERQAPQKIVVRAQPQTRQFEAPPGGDMAWYIDPNGKGTHMARKAAERLARKTVGAKVV